MHFLSYCGTQNAIPFQIKNIMKSPFTGGVVNLKCENSELTYRKEKFQTFQTYYVCEDTGETFTTDELDEINLKFVHNEYRLKYGIPFPDEIKSTRKKYGLSASKMAVILGFGDNQYRLYENGDMPSVANGKVLTAIKDVEFFRNLFITSINQFDEMEFVKIKQKLDDIVSLGNSDIEEKSKLIFEGYTRGVFNGYAVQSYSKLKNTILFFLEKMGATFHTKMNKLLFFTDFLSYKRRGEGFTGLAYKAIQYGPVPVCWDRVYALIDDLESIEDEVFDYVGTKLVSTISPDMSSFSEEEKELLNEVVAKFKNYNSKMMTKYSHEEAAWINNKDSKHLITYSEAFTLRDFNL